MTAPDPAPRKCRFHPDARMLPPVEVIDNRTGRREVVEFCMGCIAESKPDDRREFAL